jgi:hypothetical protein
MVKQVKSITRFQYREMEQKVLPAIKILSEHMHKTSPDAPKRDFHGFEVPAGMFVDNYGIQWQVKVQAVCVKSLFIKKDTIEPIIRRWAIGFKIRLFLKVFIDKIFIND